MRMILVVEDDPAIRDVVRDVLDDEGYAVTGAPMAGWRWMSSPPLPRT